MRQSCVRMLEIPADHLSATKDGESAKRFAQVKTNFSPRQGEAELMKG